MIRPPPSVAEKLLDITVSYSYESALALIQFGESDDPLQMVGEAIGSADVVPNVKPGARIPVCGAYHDCQQLRYGREGPECCNGTECVGAKLYGAPGPLNVYQTEAEAKAGVFPPAPAACLLCLRVDITALRKILSTVVSTEEAGLHRAALVLTPFQNLQECPNGYRSDCMGVTPADSYCFTPVSIAGPSKDLVVSEDEHGKFVDQTCIMYGCPKPALNCLALSTHQGHGSSACLPH